VIKGAGRDSDGKPMLIMGLDGESVTRLVAGEPIRFGTADMGLPPMTVVIVYGDHETDLVRMLTPLLAPHAVIHDYSSENGGGKG
jgi:hypothetical protein